MLQIESREFSKQQGLFACIQCGKCTGGCPISLKTRLNPRLLIYRLLIAGNGFNLEPHEELWDCTTCATCATRCPKGVSPMEAIIAMRAAFVERGRIHPNVKTALESVFRHGNPLTMPRETRGDWAQEMALKPFGDGAEYLYFVGCTPSYDPRVQKVARSLARLLSQAGIDFGILESDESCCGNEIRRLWESGLFEMMVEENILLFTELHVEKVITTSPHCFNVFKNEYPQLKSTSEGQPLSFSAQVQHYTQALAERLAQGALRFGGAFEAVVTYHDPCYLGKHNGVFDAPRQVLQGIPGVRLVEMPRSREKSLCCEGGGGRMWLEGSNPAIRLAQMRVQEALETGASVLATACPFCLLTLDEAVKHLNIADRLRVMDIAEIAAMALGANGGGH